MIFSMVEDERKKKSEYKQLNDIKIDSEFLLRFRGVIIFGIVRFVMIVMVGLLIVDIITMFNSFGKSTFIRHCTKITQNFFLILLERY